MEELGDKTEQGDISTFIGTDDDRDFGDFLAILAAAVWGLYLAQYTNHIKKNERL